MWILNHTTTSEVWYCIYSWSNGTSELEGRRNDWLITTFNDNQRYKFKNAHWFDKDHIAAQWQTEDPDQNFCLFLIQCFWFQSEDKGQWFILFLATPTTMSYFRYQMSVMISNKLVKNKQINKVIVFICVSRIVH